MQNQTPLIIQDGMLPILHKGKTLFIPIEEIVFIQSSDHYCEFHFVDKRPPVLCDRTMNYLAKHLKAYHFIRIHRQHIIRLNKIQSFHRLAYSKITMVEGTRLHLSAKFKEEFMEAISLKPSSVQLKLMSIESEMDTKQLKIKTEKSQLAHPGDHFAPS